MSDKRLIALHERRVAAVASGDAILEAAEREDRDLTDAERTALDTLQGDLAGIDADTARIRSFLRAGSGVERPASTLPSLFDTPASGPPAGGSPAPFRSLGEQLVAVVQAARSPTLTDPRLLQINAAAQGMNESVDSEGGFLVQQDFVAELYRNVWDSGAVASRCRRRPVTGNGIKVNAIDETSRADGQRTGGIQAFWTGEAATITATRPKFRRVALDLEKLTGLYYATDELLMDASALASETSAWFTDEFAFKLDDAVIRGVGGGMPIGILGHAALVTVAAEAAQIADTVVAANVQKMFGRMLPRSLMAAVWLINQGVWQQLFALTQANNAIFLPGGNIATAPFGTLLGRPIVPIEQCSGIGDVGDIIFADMGQYLLIEKGGVEMASSIHVQFLTGETAFRFVMRVNGQPLPNSVITPFKGADTLSPFITLAAR